MKKIFAVLLIICLALSLVGCGSKPDTDPVVTDSVDASQAPEEAIEPEPVSEDDTIEDEAWNELEALGQVQTEDGVVFVKITLPPDIVGADITQETLDADAGENYISAKLNNDGSVSYKMTKKQHKVMLDGLVESMEQSLQEMIGGEEYSYTKIDHNKSFTQFDVTISGTELNFYDSFGVMAFYMYCGFYGLFSGHAADNVIVNFYDVNGTLINTADSANMDG